jgi:hypothetical protein
MKCLVHTAFAAALIGTSTYSFAAQNGINYDPAHSQAFINAQKSNDLTGMTNVIKNDLAQIKSDLQFNIIKTFYSIYCTSIPTCVPIAKLANAAGLQVLLGVYEFEPKDGCGDKNGVDSECAKWTQAGVKAAYESANDYPNTVIGIVVGNEDMFIDTGKDKPDVQERIVMDIKTIKKI